MTDDRNLNKTVINVFKIMDAINSADTSIGVSELTKLTKLPKTTTFRLLDTLEYVNAVDKNSSQQYSIGPKIITYTKSIEHQNEIVRTALPLMKKFAKDTKENINIGILYNNQVLYLHSEQGEDFRLQVNLVPVAPLYCSSLGKIFLNNFSSKELSNYLKHENLVKRTINTLVDSHDIKKELQTVDADHIAYDREEYEYGLTCIAVPIYQDKVLVAAAGVSGPTSRLKVRGWDNIKNNIVQFGNELSKSL